MLESPIHVLDHPQDNTDSLKEILIPTKKDIFDNNTKYLNSISRDDSKKNGKNYNIFHSKKNNK